jgi:hypothetical protein
VFALYKVHGIIILMTRAIEQHIKKRSNYHAYYMKEIAESITEQYYDFSYGYRVLMLVFRKKDGRSGTAKKLISKDREEFMECIVRLLELAKDHDESFRIYSSVNERDIDKAIRIFKQRQLDKDYESKEARDFFYRDVKNRFISSLMKPSARAETKFLVDVDYDENDDFDVIYEELDKHTNILFHYGTKNGEHIITEPFNYNKCDIPTKINKDGQLLLFYT